MKHPTLGCFFFWSARKSAFGVGCLGKPPPRPCAENSSASVPLPPIAKDPPLLEVCFPSNAAGAFPMTLGPGSGDHCCHGRCVFGRLLKLPQDQPSQRVPTHSGGLYSRFADDDGATTWLDRERPLQAVSTRHKRPEDQGYRGFRRSTFLPCEPQVGAHGVRCYGEFAESNRLPSARD